MILDGGVETEVQRLSGRNPDQELWGTGALYQAPETVLDVHRGHLAAGCDVLSTDTWSILSAPEAEQRARLSQGDPSHWMDIARLGIQLARKATCRGRARAGVRRRVRDLRGGQLRRPGARPSSCSARMFEDDPPDLLLLETLTLIREPQTFETVELLLETGLPVWLSFRRCRHGVCGVYGQHWGPPEGDLFGRAARRFEEMGVDALLINCLPVDHVPGMRLVAARLHRTAARRVPEPRAPGRPALALRRARSAPTPTPSSRSSWRDEGAQIVGGLLRRRPPSTSPRSVRRSPSTKPGRRRPQVEDRLRSAETAAPRTLPEPWLDADGTDLFPLPLPELTLDSGVFVPTQGSFLVWKHLFRTGTRQGDALPRRRLRLRDPRGAAGAQRRRARARDRHRPQRGRQHALERDSATASATA